MNTLPPCSTQRSERSALREKESRGRGRLPNNTPAPKLQCPPSWTGGSIGHFLSPPSPAVIKQPPRANRAQFTDFSARKPISLPVLVSQRCAPSLVATTRHRPSELNPQSQPLPARFSSR